MRGTHKVASQIDIKFLRKHIVFYIVALEQQSAIEILSFGHRIILLYN